MRKLVGGLAAIVPAAFLISACLLAPTPASARVVVGVGVGVGPYWGWPGPYAYPYPYAYGPPAVVIAPPAYVAAPAYAAPATVVTPQAQSWYYCDNPSGYYPYVAACAAGWRQVPAQPH